MANKQENGKFELNWMSFLEDDPTMQKMINYLPYEHLHRKNYKSNEFNHKKLKFLGKEINKEEGTYKIPEAKNTSFLKIETPVTYKGVRSLMGTLKFCNLHLPGVGICAHPLQELLSKQVKGKIFCRRSLYTPKI